jgi:PIN domain nuclease of toxin-antitoxin system
VRLLLDTHTLLWFLNDDPSLSATARAAIENPANQKLVSIATAWEMAIKAALKKLKFVEPFVVFLGRDSPPIISTCWISASPTPRR